MAAQLHEHKTNICSVYSFQIFLEGTLPRWVVNHFWRGRE